MRSAMSKRNLILKALENSIRCLYVVAILGNFAATRIRCNRNRVAKFSAKVLVHIAQTSTASDFSDTRAESALAPERAPACLIIEMKSRGKRIALVIAFVSFFIDDVSRFND